MTAFVKVAVHQQQALSSGLPRALQAEFDILASQSCLRPAEAERALRQRLEESGNLGWTIRRGDRVRPDSCVSPGFNPADRVFVLIPVTRLEIRKGLEGVRDELLRRCLSKDAAVAFLKGVLRELGEPRAEIRTDGPVTIPFEGAEAARRHVASGCYVYSGVGWNDEGLPVYALGGQ